MSATDAQPTAPRRRALALAWFAIVCALTFLALRAVASNKPESDQPQPAPKIARATQPDTATEQARDREHPIATLDTPTPWRQATIDLQPDEAVTWIGTLRARANEGDLQADAVALRTEATCFDYERLSDEEIEERLELFAPRQSSPDTPPSLIAWREQQASEQRRGLLARRDLCATLGPIDKRAFIERMACVISGLDSPWFDQMMLSFGFSHDLYANARYAESIKALRTAYESSLERRLARGDVDALNALALGLDSGNFLSRDRERAAAYRHAMVLVAGQTDNAIPIDDSARQLGEQIARRCCMRE